MGYRIQTKGELIFNKQPSKAVRDLVWGYHTVNHPNLDPEKVEEAFGPPRHWTQDGTYGEDGEFFIGKIPMDTTLASLTKDRHVIFGRARPNGYCDWVIGLIATPGPEPRWGLWMEEGQSMGNYVDWLGFLCKRVFAPAGLTLKGVVGWSGEDDEDEGFIEAAEGGVKAYRLEMSAKQIKSIEY